nr:rna-binding protein rsd1 [Quercus suber]
MKNSDIEALLFQGAKDAARADEVKAEARKKTDHARPATGNSGSADRAEESRDDDRARSSMSNRNSRTTANRYSAEREENDVIRSRRSKDLDGGDGSSDRGSANGSVHSRNRNHARSRSPRGHGYGGNSRDPGTTDSWRPGQRLGIYRERDYDRRPDSRGTDRRDERRGSDRDFHNTRDDRSRRHNPSSRRVKTPEPTTDERDRRTVFVQQLAARLRTRDLEGFFQQVGPVVEAQIVKDRVSQRSKGVGYVEFKDEASVQKAIGLTGQKLLGIPVIVQLTEAEKNRQTKTEGGATQSNGVPFHRLYVGNIHFSVTETDLKSVFEVFGELEFATLQKEESGRSKGYGFVQFVDPDEAKAALEKMNGFDLAGRPIRVGLGNDKFTPESTLTLMQKFDSQGQQAPQGSSFSGMGGRGHYAGGTANFDKASGRDAEKSGGASALDDTDVSGVFNNISRHKLMAQLSRSDQPEQKEAPKIAQKKPAPIDHGTSSRCILLKHMWGVEDQQDDPEHWQSILKDDVWKECDAKYGTVVHIGIAVESVEGEVYVKFANVSGGIKAYQALNGRYFGGRTITAQYVVDVIYDVNFSDARGL